MIKETMIGWNISEPNKELKRYIIDRAEYLEIIKNDGYEKLSLLQSIEKANTIKQIDFRELANMNELDFTNEIKRILLKEQMC